MGYRAGQKARNEDERLAWRSTPQREHFHWRPIILVIGLTLCVTFAAAVQLASVVMAFY